MEKKNFRWFGFVLIFCVLCATQPAIPVQAAEIITTDVIWSGYHFPDQDVVIQSGGSLTIVSNATVLFNCSDGGNVGYDSNRIEIIVESGGTLTIDEAMLAGSGYPSDNCWYGIEFEPGSTGHIRDSYIRDAMRAVYVRSEVEVSGNTIDNIYGEDGSAAVPSAPTNAGSAWGIVVDVTSVESPLISNNDIRNIYGGQGVNGAIGYPSSAGGGAYGIYVYSGAPIISGNDIHIVFAGDGGDGGDGSDGANGANAVGPGAAGEDGSPGEAGLNGSLGGIAAGIYLYNAQGATVIGNEIYTIHSGDGGDGGNGGQGGNGGNGGGGVSGDPAGTNGGNGGAGGAGGAGGVGFPSRQVYAIYDTADAAEISQNLIYYIQSGIPGLGGDGGNGGLGGIGGTGGDGSTIGGDGGQGGAGGSGGIAGAGGNAGDAYCFKVESGDLQVFDRNKCSDATGRYGNDGGLGGTGGGGGAGGTAGGGGAKGNGGAGGTGGEGAAGGDAGDGGMAWGLYLHELIAVPDAVTNSIINELKSGLGGSAGSGGDGGTGGNGGAGSVSGVGGDGGNAGNGGDGGNTAGAILAFAWDNSVNLVNNTFYLPSAETYGGFGGNAGSPGLGGSGSSTGVTGADGVEGSDGYNNDAIGLSALGEVTINVFNNIFTGTSATNTVGIYEGSSVTTFNVEYNDFWNWTQDYYFPYNGSPATWVNNIDQNPHFVNAAVYDFHLTSESGCIDVGNTSATGVPSEDYEGNSRPLDGDGNGSSIVDMGAYEFDAEKNVYLPIILK